MTVSAIVYVDGVAASLAFYEAVLGVKRDHLDSDESYGELEQVGFAAGWHAERNLDISFRPNTASDDPGAFELYFEVDDVDAAFERALRGGGVAVWRPRDKPWGRAAMFRDPQGVLVQIAAG